MDAISECFLEYDICAPLGSEGRTKIVDGGKNKIQMILLDVLIDFEFYFETWEEVAIITTIQQKKVKV